MKVKTENNKILKVFSVKKLKYSTAVDSLETILEFMWGDPEANQVYHALKTTYKIYLFIWNNPR